MITISDILVSLRPNDQWVYRGGRPKWVEEIDSETESPTGNFILENIEWVSTGYTPITKQEFLEEQSRLEAQYAATEYQRLRQPEYPPLSDLADALYWQAQGDESKMTAYLAAVDAVKQKYPKE